jgi:hypothetical protein
MMPRRSATITQADIARVLRAYRNEGVKVCVVIRPDGSTAFEPSDKIEQQGDAAASAGREIVL